MQKVLYICKKIKMGIFRIYTFDFGCICSENPFLEIVSLHKDKRNSNMKNKTIIKIGTMKFKKLSAVTLLIFGLSNLQAQEVIPATGGNACGGSGSASYTVGQIVYTTNQGTGGNTVAQGVQQPYEISVVTGIEEAKDINLSVLAYPNPTSDYLTVKVDASTLSTQSMQYQVFDINGKLIQTVKVTGQETQIQTSQLVPAHYFVKVLDNKKEIKVFKIIKN